MGVWEVILLGGRLCACPEKQSLLWKFSLYLIYIFLSFRIFEQLALAQKTEFDPKFFKPPRSLASYAYACTSPDQQKYSCQQNPALHT